MTGSRPGTIYLYTSSGVIKALASRRLNRSHALLTMAEYGYFSRDTETKKSVFNSYWGPAAEVEIAARHVQFAWLEEK